MRHKLMSKLLITFVTASMFVLPLFAQESNKILIRTNCAAYEEPSEESPKTAYIKKDEIFKIIVEIENYYGIVIEDNTIVYIEKSFTEIIKEEDKADNVEDDEIKEETQEKIEDQIQEVIEEKVDEQTKEENDEALKKDLGIEICNFAKQYVGTPYVSGGTNLTKGVDCSGFTQTVYKKYGIQLQRRSRDQFSANGVKIQRDELKPGDLVFYYSPVSHVAIYIGDGKIVHASTSNRGVVIDPVSMNGMVPVGYKRVV